MGTFLHNYDISAKSTHSKHKDLVFALALYWFKKKVQIITLESLLLARSGALERLHLDLVLTKHLEIF